MLQLLTTTFIVSHMQRTVLVANPNKTTLYTANPARGLLNRKKKKKSLAAHSPPRAARN